MTVKAKRAKALPLLDKDTGPATGELVDESISADAESLIQSLNGQFGDELLLWFRSQIGTFRAIHELPATHEELRMKSCAWSGNYFGACKKAGCA